MSTQTILLTTRRLAGSSPDFCKPLAVALAIALNIAMPRPVDQMPVREGNYFGDTPVALLDRSASTCIHIDRLTILYVDISCERLHAPTGSQVGRRVLLYTVHGPCV